MPWYVLNENILYVLSLQEVHIQNVQFTKDLLNTSHADVLTTKPLGPLAEEPKTSYMYISSIA